MLRVNSAVLVGLPCLLLAIGCSPPKRDPYGQGGGGGATSATTTAIATTTTTTASAGGGGGGGPVHAEPPPPGGIKLADGKGSVTFAITKLYLGDTDRGGVADLKNGWKSYGYDLDQRISNEVSTDLCAPLQNASPVIPYPDGKDGIDNSFGKNVLPNLLQTYPTIAMTVNDALAAGKPRLLIDLQGLGADADYDPLPGRAFLGGDLGGPPKLDGSDSWPVSSDSLMSATDVNTAITTFPQGYLVHNTWVGRTVGTVVLELALPFAVRIPIQNAVITMDLDAAHHQATSGTIAGTIPTTELVKIGRDLVGSADPMQCMSALNNAVVTELEQASDILSDATQNPAKPCDAVSIGLGFDAKMVSLGSIVTPVPLQHPCTDCDKAKCVDALSTPNPTPLCPQLQALFDAYENCACTGACGNYCGPSCVSGMQAPATCATCVGDTTKGCGKEYLACKNN